MIRVVGVPSPDQAAIEAADLVEQVALEAIERVGRFVWAVSGGRTPAPFLCELARRRLDWPRVHLLQVDERITPAGDPRRNDTMIRASLVDRVPLVYHPLPVEAEDLAAALGHHLVEVGAFAGQPLRLDLVHLGIGADGHTASLVPGDPVLDLVDPDAPDLAVTGVYQATRRVTMTAPALRRAAMRLVLVTGLADDGAKRAALARVLAGDPAVPASLVMTDPAVIVADG